MANTIVNLNNQNKALKVLGLFCFMLLLQKGSAREFLVGKSWGVPDDANSYNKWAENNRFQINDSLVFVYPSGNDSVLVVNQDAYNNCSTESPIAKHNDGHTIFTFDRSGPFYFISGERENCVKGEKLVVVVLADRGNNTSHTGNTTTASPPAPGTAETTPSPAPTAGPGTDEGETTPSPAPISMETPPSGTVEINPTPAPVSEQSPPPNAASTIFMTSVGYIGAFVASSLILAF